MSNTEALRTAAQTALEALEAVYNDEHGSTSFPATVYAAITELRAALDQPAETDAELERRTGEPHVDGWPLYSGLPPAASGEPADDPHAYSRRCAAAELERGPWGKHAAQPAPAPAEVTTGSIPARMTEADEARLHVALGGVFGWKDAQPAPALVPPGWVLVPVEPTPEMLAVNVDPGEYVSIEAARILWRAMLAAAPDAQKGRHELLHPRRENAPEL